MTFSNAFSTANVWILLQISLKFVVKFRINNILALATRHYLNQWWWVYWLIYMYASHGLNWLNMISSWFHQTTARGYWGRRTLHDNVMMKKRFPHFWHFVRAIHGSPMDPLITSGFSVRRGYCRSSVYSLLSATSSCWINSGISVDWGHRDAFVMSFLYCDLNLFYTVPNEAIKFRSILNDQWNSSVLLLCVLWDIWLK